MIVIDNILDVENYIADIEGVIFDLDDTLYSEKEYVRSGYKKIADLFDRPDIKEKLWQVFLQGGKAIDVVLEKENLLEYKDKALNVYRNQQPDIHLYSGVEALLTRIHENGKKIGLITDGRPEGQRAKISALHLKDKIDYIIITDELGGVQYRKPCETAFVEMQKRLNIPYDQMCYIGDNIKKDFIAPEKLGMKAIYFTNKEGLYFDKNR